ncbi:hypothetical protein GP486_007471 [Trichoglossum hirsutum]|uniref:Aminoglycoside phosphotransferase domain-containing protein n=1 Tax=Trichoglossum hirsutum TaxID=265104 RepID=A0A9P8IFR5_9PEZI|nr:hypothetical protein GP486_007471 [Trichoglossum hirsutum]
MAKSEKARTILGLPVPRVLGWSCHSSNPVGSEYIIMEKAKGTALGDSWYQLPNPVKHAIIEQVVEVESKFALLQFSEHGCIYYTNDLSTEYRHEESDPLPGDSSRKFCIGPLVESTLWDNGRSEMGLSRGPWRGLPDYAKCLGVNERAWAKQFARPRMNYYRSKDTAEMPTEYLDLIEKYLALAPCLSASQANWDDLSKPTLWHHDFHLNNIYVDLSTNTIADIIDWQSVSVAPLLLQARIPRMVRHFQPLPLGWVMPERPADYSQLDEKRKLKVDKNYESALCQKYYEIITAKRNPRHYSAITHNDGWKAPHIEPLKVISGAWSSGEVFRLRSSLMAACEHWQELQTEPNECPITFSKEDKDLHNEETENRGYVEELMEEFQVSGILPADGIVEPEDYETLQTTNLEQKKKFMSLAENESQKAWMNKIWPYQDDPEV